MISSRPAQSSGRSPPWRRNGSRSPPKLSPMPDSREVDLGRYHCSLVADLPGAETDIGGPHGEEKDLVEWLETRLVDASPLWLTRLTTQF
jgi:hypothetical protein